MEKEIISELRKFREIWIKDQSLLIKFIVFLPKASEEIKLSYWTQSGV